MSPELKEKILTPYPEWRRRPLRLNNNEIDKPIVVLQEFFEVYDLPNIRACLQQWFADAIQNDEVEAIDHYQTYQHIEKLVEAVWLIYRKRKK